MYTNDFLSGAPVNVSNIHRLLVRILQVTPDARGTQTDVEADLLLAPRDAPRAPEGAPGGVAAPSPRLTRGRPPPEALHGAPERSDAPERAHRQAVELFEEDRDAGLARALEGGADSGVADQLAQRLLQPAHGVGQALDRAGA